MSCPQADLSHELLSGEDQLMVDEPAGLLLEQRAVGVNIDCLLVFHCLVATLAQSCSVIEISGCNCLGGEQKGRRGVYIN